MMRNFAIRNNTSERKFIKIRQNMTLIKRRNDLKKLFGYYEAAAYIDSLLLEL